MHFTLYKKVSLFVVRVTKKTVKTHHEKEQGRIQKRDLLYHQHFNSCISWSQFRGIPTAGVCVCARVCREELGVES